MSLGNPLPECPYFRGNSSDNRHFEVPMTYSQLFDAFPKKFAQLPIPRDNHTFEGFPKRYSAKNLDMVDTEIFVDGMLMVRPQNKFQLG